MAKKYKLVGAATYATILMVFVAGVTYTEQQVGEYATKVTEDGDLFFAEVEDEGKETTAPVKRSVVIGKKNKDVITDTDILGGATAETGDVVVEENTDPNVVTV